MAKILIVEDEAYIADMYKLKFELEGFAVLVANDGREGLRLARETAPDIVLLDIVLPIMDGYDVLAGIRGDPATRGLKVFILSNLGQSAEIKKGMQNGADGYFVKASMTPKQLVESVRKALAAPVAKPAGV